MGYLELYILFSLTTAIVAGIQLYSRVHSKLRETHKEDQVTLSPWAAHIVFGALVFIIAPIMIVILLLPKSMDEFVDSMYESITS